MGLVTPIRERVVVGEMETKEMDTVSAREDAGMRSVCMRVCDIHCFNLSLKCFTNAFQLFKKGTNECNVPTHSV